MRIDSQPAMLAVVAGALAGAVSLAPTAAASTDGKDCRDAGSVSVCQKPGHSSISPSVPDLATQQLLGPPPNSLPPLVAIG